MTQHTTAIYDAGVLKPLGPLTLQDQEVVSLVVETAESASTGAVDSDKTLFTCSMRSDGLARSKMDRRT